MSYCITTLIDIEATNAENNTKERTHMKNSQVIASTPKQLLKLVKASNSAMRKEVAKKRKELRESNGVKWQIKSRSNTLGNDLKAFIEYNERVLSMHKQIVEWAIEDGEEVSEEVKLSLGINK